MTHDLTAASRPLVVTLGPVRPRRRRLTLDLTSDRRTVTLHLTREQLQLLHLALDDFFYGCDC